MVVEVVDRADYAFALDAVVVVLNTNGTDGTAQDGYGTTDVLRNMENVRGSEYADSITGNELANKLEGTGGNDTLIGLAGDDTLIGGSGNDSMAGWGWRGHRRLHRPKGRLHHHLRRHHPQSHSGGQSGRSRRQ
jgi:Ca2+-binding RTX toxin-like protein